MHSTICLTSSRTLLVPLLAVALTAAATAQTNLAVNGTASQSSTGYGGLASRANDGNTNPLWNGGSISHTDNLVNSWWEVDLGGTFPIAEVRLYNRGDCCGSRLSNFRVSVFDGPTEVFGQDYFTGTGSVAKGGVHSAFPLGGAVGDRVRVGFNGFNNLGNGFLHLAEVEVYDGSVGMRFCRPAVVNSTGASGEMGARGSALVSSNDVTLSATRLPMNSFGFFLTSLTPGNAQQPGGSQGTLCLGGSIGRYVAAGQIQNSGSAGSFDLVVDLTRRRRPPASSPWRPARTGTSSAGTATPSRVLRPPTSRTG